METENAARPGASTARDSADAQRFTALALAAGGAAWVALAGVDPKSAIIGVPAALAAALAARASGGWRYAPRTLRAPGFALWFAVEIVRSAWAVARLLLARDARLAPEVVGYRLRLEGEGARAAFMNAVTLTPGTLSAGLAGDRLAVHALVPDDGVAASLADMEERVARLYGETLAERPA